MKELVKVFENNEFGQIRTLEVDGAVWFVASDVAKALGYARPNDAVNAHCRYTAKRRIPHPQGKGTLEMNTIPEGDLYRLIAKSELPSAEKFESWVFDEILPTIRKTGSYSVKQAPALPDFTNPAVAARAWAEQFEKRELVEKENLALTAQIETLKPKADYTDKILQNKGLVAITQIAKDYGMSGKIMNQKLHELKIIYKIGKQWVLYADYQAKGYTHSDTFNFKHNDGRDDVTMNTKWTQKGRLFLYEKLKKHGILPMIEQC